MIQFSSADISKPWGGMRYPGAARDKNICRLDVTMNDAFGMAGIKGVSDFDAQVNQELGRERTA